jgi:diguanylate cyclase (GGDEF)-like protein
MTGLLNRRGFLDAVKRSLTAPPMQNGVAGAAIPGFTIPGVLIIDIDHFKRVNDRHGHAVGDAVIQSVAKVIQTTVRQNDLPARFGGEEFVVVVPDATEGALAALAERIRTAVRRPRLINGVSLEVSVSIGVAITSAKDADVQDTIDRADVALYQAKESGRNCVKFSGEPGPMVLAAA